MTGLSEAGRLSILEALRDVARGAGRIRLADIFTDDVRWRGSHPLGALTGVDALHAGLWQPLRTAFPDLERRDDIFMAGVYKGDVWIAATGYYFGTFAKDWLGIPGRHGWAHLRFGEHYRLEDGKIAEAFVLFDLLDLMRQAGVSPWRAGLGVETLSPGPATRDGVRLRPSSAADTDRTINLMHAMLGSLFEPDRASAGMERFWHPDMMWYGPCGIGATRGLDGFFRFHEDPWVAAFPDWRTDGKGVYLADDVYAALVGWPSLKATQSGALLGLAPTNRPVEINLMDFYRRDGGLLAENWIFIDLPHLFLQLGVDLFQIMRDKAAERQHAVSGD